jgi:hypothetical protein
MDKYYYKYYPPGYLSWTVFYCADGKITERTPQKQVSSIAGWNI